MDYIASINKGLTDKKTHAEIVRKVLLTFPTLALIGEEERQFEILNEISQYFNIPINSIQVTGSAKVGQSFHKLSIFTPKISDLDVAIINADLFIRYSELVYRLTNGFSDKTTFSKSDGNSNFSQYTKYISKGIFRPDLMPTCTDRAKWNKFFGQLSSKHRDLFKSISAGIYLSQTYFEYKQTSIIKDYITNNPI